MAVHVEGITVIVLASSMRQCGKTGSWFRKMLRNRTFATDGFLLRGAFMNPADVEHFVAELEEAGLWYEVNGAARDIAVADQIHGLAVPTPWLSLFQLKLRQSAPILCAKAVDEGKVYLALPDGWSYENSLYTETHFVPLDDESGILPLYQSDGIDTVVDLVEGAVVHRASSVRPDIAKRPKPALDLAVSEQEVFDREEQCIEYIRVVADRDGTRVSELIVPKRSWWRPKPTRALIYARPTEKSLSALAQMYGQTYRLDILLAWLSILYGTEAANYYRGLAEALQRGRAAANDAWLKKRPDGPLPTRRPVSSEWLRTVEKEMPSYDALLACRP